MRRYCLLIFFFAMVNFQMYGQSWTCSYGEEEWQNLDRLVSNRQLGRELVDSAIYIPVKLHLVGKTDGSGHIDENKVLDLMCMLNELTNKVGVYFYIFDRFNYVDDDSLYYAPLTSSSLIKLRNLKHPSALNLFIVFEIGANTLAIFNGPADSVDDFIIAEMHWITEFNSVPHAFGHFASLAHTHRGWEQFPYSAVHMGMPAPAIASDGFTATEKMDGSNCLTAADKICDTSPDYNFSYDVNILDTCQLSANVLDPCSVAVATPSNNIMGPGYRTCGDYEFSADQLEAIKLDLFSPERVYLQTGYLPDTLPITGDLDYTYPVNDTTIYFDEVRLEWETLPGAESYIVQISHLPSFSFQSQQYILYDQNYLTLTNLAPNRTYYWRIRPFKELYSCAPFRETVSFGTGGGSVQVRSIKGVNGWAVLPNPVRSSEQLQLQLDANEAFEAQLKLYSVTGQQLKHFGVQQFSSGANTVVLDVNDLETGMYFLMIETAEGLLTEKIVLAD